MGVSSHVCDYPQISSHLLPWRRCGRRRWIFSLLKWRPLTRPHVQSKTSQTLAKVQRTYRSSRRDSTSETRRWGGGEPPAGTATAGKISRHSRIIWLACALESLSAPERKRNENRVSRHRLASLSFVGQIGRPEKFDRNYYFSFLLTLLYQIGGESCLSSEFDQPSS
jgi:hypothetical protein